MEQKLVLTVEQTAEILGISNPTAYKGVEKGVIPSIRIGRRILIPKAALEKAGTSRGVSISVWGILRLAHISLSFINHQPILTRRAYSTRRIILSIATIC